MTTTAARWKTALAACLTVVCITVFSEQTESSGAELAGLSLLALPWGKKKRQEENREPDYEPEVSDVTREVDEQQKQNSDPSIHDIHQYVEQLLSQGRHLLLLRPEVAENVREDQIKRAIEQLHQEMALVPQGDVFLQQPELTGERESEESPRGQLVSVEPLFLDRYTVTNRQYKRFVDAGGYDDASLWDETALAAVFDFVDTTQQPAPRFWVNGVYPKGHDDRPVVGVSWYEAMAYSRWAGKRLPTDPEWVKAGAWPVSTDEPIPRQRKYPWGDTFKDSRSNLSSSGIGRIVSVHDFEEGVSVGGIHQLIGNVWEWTASVFGQWHCYQQHVRFQEAFKGIRGGAYDTYFENHASCQFQSGDDPLARKSNIGFRCALSIRDIVTEALEPGGSST